MDDYNPDRLYSDAFTIAKRCKWEDILPKEMFEWHDLTMREINSAVALQMGNILPFVSALCGPTTRSLFLTKPSVINLFWLNIAASGVGKSQCRTVLVDDCMEYMQKKCGEEFDNFSVSRYTRAGIEDRIKATKGYLYVLTDEGTIFFEDLSRKQSKHETDMSLINQLYDGKGDKTTLAQNRERIVPPNATALSIAIQPEPFIICLDKMGKQLWLDNGFGERFLFTTVQPYRFPLSICKQAKKMKDEKYDADLLNRVALAIYEHHHDASICYELNEEANDLYESIFDRYNQQFNMRYAFSDCEDFTSSQPKLDHNERSEIAVRTKAAELIGRLASVLWIYCNAFMCILKGRPFSIGKEITKDYIAKAEAIVNNSYCQSETFSSAVLCSKNSSQCAQLGKPKVLDRTKVVNYIIRHKSPVISIRNMAKNMRNMTTEVVRAELEKLVQEGIGWIVTQDTMKLDKVLPANSCFTGYLKPDITYIDPKFWDMCTDKDTCRDEYARNFMEDIDPNKKRVIIKYHPHNDIIPLSGESQVQGGTVNNERKRRRKELMGFKTPPKDALDALLAEGSDGDFTDESSARIDRTKGPQSQLPKLKDPIQKSSDSSNECESEDNSNTEHTDRKRPYNYTMSKAGKKFLPTKKGLQQGDHSINKEGEGSNAVEQEQSQQGDSPAQKINTVPEGEKKPVEDLAGIIPEDSKENSSSSDDRDTGEDSAKPAVPNTSNAELNNATVVLQSNIEPNKSAIDVNRVKTGRWGTRVKVQAESQPIRQSIRIRDQTLKKWKESNGNSSTDTGVSASTQSGRKRKLSRAQRDSNYSNKSKLQKKK